MLMKLSVVAPDVAEELSLGFRASLTARTPSARATSSPTMPSIGESKRFRGGFWRPPWVGAGPDPLVLRTRGVSI